MDYVEYFREFVSKSLELGLNEQEIGFFWAYFEK
jgi:hypothetical protein